MFEAAALVGVTLFEAEESDIKARSARMDDRLAVLPKHVHKTRTKVMDEF